MAHEIKTGEISQLPVASENENNMRSSTITLYSAPEAIKYISECDSPDTLKTWYKKESRNDVRTALMKKMESLGIDPSSIELNDDVEEDVEEKEANYTVKAPEATNKEESLELIPENNTEAELENFESQIKSMKRQELIALCKRHGLPTAEAMRKNKDLLVQWALDNIVNK